MAEILNFNREMFFNENFPLTVKHVVNSANDYNDSKRFTRDFWKLTFVIKGNSDLIINNQTFKVKPNTLFLVHPQDQTTYKMNVDALELINILFDPILIQNFTAQLKDDFKFFSIFLSDYPQKPRPPIYIIEANKELHRAIIDIENEFEEKDLNYKALAKIKLQEILILMLRQGAFKVQSMEHNDIILYINSFLNANFHKSITLDNIAKNIGISTGHMCRLYKEYQQSTIVENLNNIRLNKAATLLLQNISISDTAFACGYNDLSYFYRLFRKKFHMSPKLYQKNKY